MADAAGEAIETGNHDHIELPRAGILHQPIECRSGILTAADAFVSILLSDYKSTMGGIVTKRDTLSLCGLSVAFSTDSHIKCGPLHCCPHVQPGKRHGWT